MAKRATKDTVSVQQNRLFFATNRANVLPILSSGLIRPRAAYDKYYDDLLMLCPGRVPLFHGTCPQTIVGLTSANAGIFPVLVEVDPQKLPAPTKAYSIKMDLSVTSGKPRRGSKVLCELVDVAIPISAIKALCFASEANLRDFQSRDFDNLLPLPPLGVEPSLFGEGGPDPEQFKNTLTSVAAGTSTPDDFRRLDAAMGAIAMVCHLLPSSMSWLNALSATMRYPMKSKGIALGSPAWLNTLVERILTSKQIKTKSSTVDERLVDAAIQVLRNSRPRDGWVETKIATEIATLAMNEAPADQVKEIESWRDVVIAIAKADKEPGSLDDMGSIVRRGLLLFIIRCKPERIARAAESFPKLGPQVLAVAGLFSGLFHGYSLLSKEFKKQGNLPNVLSRLAVLWWSSNESKARKLTVTTTEHQEDQMAVRVTVAVEQDVLVERVFRPSNTMMRIFFHAKEVGYSMGFDPALNALICETGPDGSVKRRILLESGIPTPRGQATIRIRTECCTNEGKPIPLSKKEDAVALLQRNYNPSTHCLFAVNPASDRIEVLAHQLLETMDTSELQSHIESVGTAATQFETDWASRTGTTKRHTTRKTGTE